MSFSMFLKYRQVETFSSVEVASSTTCLRLGLAYRREFEMVYDE